MPGLMALREEFGADAAARRRAHRRLAAHDRADRRAHRDARRARRAGALGELQHLLHAGRGRRGRRGRPDRHRRRPRRRAGVRLEGRDPRGVLVVHRPHLRLERRGRRGRCRLDRPEPDPRRRRRRHPARAQGPSSSSGPAPCPDGDGRRQPRVPRRARHAARARSAVDPTAGPASPPSISGVTEETTTGVHRLYELHARRRAAVPGDQRQRLGHQVASSTTSTASATRCPTA